MACAKWAGPAATTKVAAAATPTMLPMTSQICSAALLAPCSAGGDRRSSSTEMAG